MVNGFFGRSRPINRKPPTNRSHIVLSTINIKKACHARKNYIRLAKPIFCLKCKSESNRKVTAIYYIGELYGHYLATHSDLDKNERPTRDYCIEELQKFSDHVLDEVEN